jgi:hypothetical protein
MATPAATQPSAEQWSQKLQDFSGAAWWRNADVAAVGTRADRRRWRISDKLQNEFAMASSRIASAVESAGVLFTVIRLVSAPVSGAASVIWEVMFNAHSGKSRVQQNAFGAYGHVDDQVDSWSVSVLAIVQKAAVSDVNVFVMPAASLELGKYDKTAKGDIIIRDIDARILSLTDAAAASKRMQALHGRGAGASIQA